MVKDDIYLLFYLMCMGLTRGWPTVKPVLCAWIVIHHGNDKSQRGGPKVLINFDFLLNKYIKQKIISRTVGAKVFTIYVMRYPMTCLLLPGKFYSSLAERS